MKISRLLALAACVAFFSFSSCVFSQYLRVGVDGEIPIGTLADMNGALDITDATQKSDLLTRLGIDKEIAEAAANTHAPEAISIQAVRVSPQKTLGVVFLPCGTQAPVLLQAFLYVLDNAGANSWHAIDHVALDCFHQKPTYRVVSLTPSEDSILVQHAHAGHGSDMVLEDHTTLYSMKAGKFHQLLSTKDFWSQADPMDPSSITEQTSSFLFFPRQKIEETRITAHNGSPQKVERRLWRWSPGKQAFSADPFTTVTQ